MPVWGRYGPLVFGPAHGLNGLPAFYYAMDAKEAQADEQWRHMSEIPDGEACLLLDALFAEHGVPASHGTEHARRVLTHAARALACAAGVPKAERRAVLWAALLHDADDRKYFPASRDYANARAILRRLDPAAEDRAVALIGYVAASQNRNAIPAEAGERPWVLYPRHADRLEALGWVGVVRAWEYTLERGRPLWTDATPKPTTGKDAWAAASDERYAAYRGGSASMLDHYYDKLLPMSRAEETGSSYFSAEYMRRQVPLLVVCLEHTNGTLTDQLLDLARRMVDTEFRRDP